MARQCDIRRDILEFYVEQCTLVKSGAALVVKSNEFENLNSLL